jgi:hypothetical protein
MLPESRALLVLKTPVPFGTLHPHWVGRGASIHYHIPSRISGNCPMAGFKAHITGSTLCGIGYGIAGYTHGIPWPSCAVAGLAFSVSGMLPDLDSPSGKPAKEILSLSAAVVPALMIPRFQQLGLHHERAVLAIAACYMFIRYMGAAIFRTYTVHRGMWHSIPAAAIAGVLTFILVHGDCLEIRLFKAGGVVLGFMCHLLIDEIWSVGFRYGIPRFKNSFGTALKFFSRGNLWSSVATYGILAATLVFTSCDPYLMKQLGVEEGEAVHSVRKAVANAAERGRQVIQNMPRQTVLASRQGLTRPRPSVRE